MRGFDIGHALVLSKGDLSKAAPIRALLGNADDQAGFDAALKLAVNWAPWIIGGVVAGAALLGVAAAVAIKKKHKRARGADINYVPGGYQSPQKNPRRRRR